MVNDSRDENAKPGPYRRDVMKAAGAGTALGVFGGVAAADEHEDGEYDEDQDAADVPNDEVAENTVHVVRTLIGESTNPGRPADFFYEPTGLHVEPGDVVRFVFETPDHTVTFYHPAFGMQRRVPIGVGAISSPILGWDPATLPDDAVMPPMEDEAHDGDDPPNGDESVENDRNGENGAVDEYDGEHEDGPRPSTWLYSFDTPGVYDLECAPHEAFGMAMRVVVGDETETEFETTNAEELPPPRVGPVGLSRQVLTDPQLEPETIVERGRVEWLDLEANRPPEDEPPEDEPPEDQPPEDEPPEDEQDYGTA